MRDAAVNVIDLLRQSAQRRGDRWALVMPSRRGCPRQITFAELWDRVDRAGDGLRRRGLAPGDRAIVMIPMSIDLYIALLAVLKIGAVGVFVDPWIDVRRIAAFAAFASPCAWLGSPKSHLLRLLSPALRRLPLTITTGSRCGGLLAEGRLADLLDSPGEGRIQPVAADDPALITFTTGSSGAPKGVNRTHGFLAAQRCALHAEFPLRDDDIDMPMFPIFALGNLAAGVTSVIPQIDFRRPAAARGGALVEQMQRHGVTTCAASPPLLDRLVARLSRSPEPTARLRLRRILTGGAPVRDDQLRAWRRALPDTQIVVAYGSTEAEPVACISAEERLSAASGCGSRPAGYCVGRPSSLLTACVIRRHLGPVRLDARGWRAWLAPPGEVGELIVCGEHVCRDYYRNPGAAAENKIVDADGAVWHRMGDTGCFDEQGRFWLAGRLHTSICRQGRWFDAQILEQAARGGDGRIRQAAAVGLPDPKLGERVVVAIYAPGARREAKSLLAQVRVRLAAASLPMDAVVLATQPLPVDPRHNAKIDYEALRRRLMRHAPPEATFHDCVAEAPMASPRSPSPTANDEATVPT